MAGCEHKSCGSSEKVWLPHIYRGMDCGLKPHPYCAECGLIKSLSSDKPRKIGFYINLVAVLGEHLKVTQVQMRLISMALENAGLDDTYGMDRYQQETLFTQIVRKYIPVPEQVIRELF